MGLLDSITKAAKSVITAITPTKAKIENVGAVLNAAFNPFSKDTVVANVSNPTLKSALETVANHPYVSAGIVAGGITAVTNPAAAAKVVSSVIPKSTVGKVVTVAAVPIAAGAIVSQPTKSAAAIISAPSNLANFGGNLGNLIAEPSLANLKDLAKENPVLTTLAGAGAVAAIGGGIGLAANTLATFQNSQATKENTGAAPTTATAGETAAAGALLPEKAVATDEYLPQTASTTTVSTSRKRRKAARTQEKQSVNQKVQVIVSNRAMGNRTTKFIKEVPYIR